MGYVIVRVIDLPFGVDGMTVKDENDDFNVYINARLSKEMQDISYAHELDHIARGHFYSADDVRTMESVIPF